MNIRWSIRISHHVRIISNRVLGGADIPVCPGYRHFKGRQECLPHRGEICGLTLLFVVLASTMILTDATQAADLRRVVPLDGAWQVAEGALNKIPSRFDRRVPVPGLIDMAQPPFAEVGVAKGQSLRQAFWYRRVFTLDGPVPSVATLKVHKACYGTRVYLNGAFVGEHLPCFTPGLFNVHDHLRGDGKENELVICVGTRESLPKSIYHGIDGERTKFIPGIYDSVELILSSTPHIETVQAVPDVDGKAVRVVAKLVNVGSAHAARMKCRVTEAVSGKPAGAAESPELKIAAGEQTTVEVRVPIAGCRLWSPDDPFLYRLEVDTATDQCSVRFGMRTFGFDAKTKLPMLNGKPYWLRGTNVCIFRFFEDSERGDRPWREDWVRRLHESFRGMHFNAARYCIGFPPEKWYDIADETGLMIQDEFPVWYDLGWPKELTGAELANEFREWMRERWNHPSVIIWDAQNETNTNVTGEVIREVRGLDLSDRPWDNGWSPPDRPTDTYEVHPYAFIAWPPNTKATSFRLSDFAHLPGVPGVANGVNTCGAPLNVGHNPVIINEYDWLWLTRDGWPTTLSKENYAALLGPGATADQRRELYARYMAAITEFWRCHRQVAGLLYFCGLGYSRRDGETGDNFINVEQCTFEPHWVRYVRDAFAPVGLMVDFWDETPKGGQRLAIPVVAINDLPEEWRGQVRLRLLQGDVALFDQSQDVRIAPAGQATAHFEATLPAAGQKLRFVAELTGYKGETVRSVREFTTAGKP
jgi:beta-galactosidase